MEPLVLMVAPNGARRSKADHPNLPMTPQELAKEAVRCSAAGATVIHLHVRTVEGQHSLDAELYRSAIHAVRAVAGDQMAIQITTESVGLYTPEAQIEVVREIQPEAVSLALRELIPDEAHIDQAAEFLSWLRVQGIAPQYILYTPEDVARFHELRRVGVIPQLHPWVLFVLGRYAGPTESRASDLLGYLEHHENGSPWSACAFGRTEAATVLTAAALGGHVRVGFENNVRRRDDSLAQTNADLVGQIRREAALVDRPLADIEATRAFLTTTAA